MNYEPDWTKGREDMLSTRILYVILLNIETWFKVTAHPLLKGTLLVRYEPGWAKGSEDMLQTSNLRWTDR